MGGDFEVKIKKRGYYPRGGGTIELIVPPVAKLKPITLLDKGEIQSVTIRAFTSKLDTTTAVMIPFQKQPPVNLF